jgi:hypothetical protein
MGLVVVPIPEQMAQAFEIDLNVVQRCPMLGAESLQPLHGLFNVATRIEMWNQSRMCATGPPAAVLTRAGSAGRLAGVAGLLT